jgi:superfamily II DNA or RNA helicase
MTELRPYQTEVVEDFWNVVVAGKRRIMIVAPTAAGKTVIGAAIIKTATAEHKSGALVLAHRREIVTQTGQKLAANGVRYGIIQAGVDPRPMEIVQVASIQTLHVRAVRSDAMQLPPARLVIVDECHHVVARSYQEIIDQYPDAILLGLTATPCRGDGRGLGGVFEVIIECPQVQELIDGGFLVRTKVFAPVNPNLTGVSTVKGDYHEGQLGDAMDKQTLVADIVTSWFRHNAERRKTVAFAVNVQHSIHIRDEFVRAGVRADHIDGTTPKPERDTILARLASGETEIVTNCMVLTEGWDMPDIGAIILARPTKKMGLYRQMIGRGLRPAPGKTDCIVLDHSGAVFRHGFVEDPVEWTLDPDRRAASKAHEARGARGTEAGLLECSQCGAMRLGGQPCPHCGFLPKRPGRDVEFRDGELGLVAGGKARANEYDRATRDRWHGMFVAIALERGYAPGWVAHKYKDKFGAWPAWGIKPAPIEPSPEVKSWARSRDIAYAKRRSAA